jgi:SAM-dependent methyltransferase
MKEGYSKIYKDLEAKHWWWQARRKIVVGEMKKRNNGKKVLDIGCGTGQTIKAIENKFECTGVEPDDNLRKIAMKNTNSVIVPGELPHNLPDSESEFDNVLLLDVLEHIDKDKESLLNIRSLLTKDGLLYINVPAMKWLWSQHDINNKHKRRYERREILGLLGESGYEIEKVRYWGFMLVPFALFIERGLLKKKIENSEYIIPPKKLNDLFKAYTDFEYRLTEGLELPFGLSLFAVAKKADS